MKVLHSIITIVVVGFTIVACGTQSDKKLSLIHISEPTRPY